MFVRASPIVRLAWVARAQSPLRFAARGISRLTGSNGFASSQRARCWPLYIAVTLAALTAFAGGANAQTNISGASSIPFLSISYPYGVNATAPAQLTVTGGTQSYGQNITQSGSGDVLSLTYNNAGGTLTLSGANTYSGGTTLSAGTIAVGASTTGVSSITSGPLGTGPLAMAVGTTLSFAGTGFTIANPISMTGGATINASGTTQTLSGVISDGSSPGAITVGGAGTLILSGNNTYSGGTTINSGAALQLGNGFTGGTINGAITNNGILIIDHADNVAIPQSISGAGAFEQNGTGTTVLTGASTYTGTTTVNAGTLTVNGSITSAATVNPGATLSGSGTIQSATLASGATLTPGSAAGSTMTLNGLTLATASNYFVQFSTTGSTITSANVIGTAALTGTLTASGTGGTYTATSTYNVLNATTLSGSFTNLAIAGNGSFGNYAPYLTYNTSGPTQSVVLNLTSGTAWTSTSSSNWASGANWAGGAVPSGAQNGSAANAVATFTGGAGLQQNITISATESAGAMLFTSSVTAPYNFTINGGQLALGGAPNSIPLAGVGIDDNSGNPANAPRFTVGGGNGPGLLAFQNAATAGDAVITNNAGSNVLFLNSSSAGTATITNAGNVIFYGNSSASLATITTNGGGTTTFVGNSTGGNANFFTNSTSASSFGTLNFASAIGPLSSGNVSAGSIQGTGANAEIILGGSTLTITSGFGSFAGVVSSSGGGLTLAGGTTTLSGANTYTGQTTIAPASFAPATLALTGSGSIASSSGVYIASGGTFDISQTTSGASITTLADSAYGQAGTVNLGGQTLTVTNASTTFSGTIGGSGGLSLTGGTLTLAGTSSYQGATNVTGAGSLSVIGDLSSSSGLAFNSTGILSGTGNLPGVTFSSAGGTLMPGTTLNPTGTLTIRGSLTLQTASTYLVTLNTSSNSSVAVTGTAALNNATLVVASNSQITSGATYTLLTAARGYSGQFTAPATIVASGATYKETLNYSNPNAVTASFTQTAPAPPSPTQRTTIAASYVPAGVNAFGMQNSFTTTMLNPTIGNRGGSPGAYGPALGFAPEDPPNTQGLYNFATPNAPLDALMRSLDRDYTYSVWSSAYGGYSSLSGNASTGPATANITGGGVAVGVDYRFKQDTVVGFALGGGGTSWSATGANSGTSTVFQAGLYGSQRLGQAYISGSIAYVFDELTNVRAATFNSSFNGNGADGRLEGGYRFQLPQVNLTPYVAAEIFALATPAYSETANNGAVGAMQFSSQTTTDVRTELGLWVDRILTLDGGTKLLFAGKAGYAHDFWNNVSLNGQFLSLPTPSFTVTGITPPANIGLASFMSEVRLASNWAVGVKLDGEFASGMYSLGGTGTVRYSW